MNTPLCIVILSCWRSGTSWLEDILGKQVRGSTMFGHEQQLFPLLAMMRRRWAGECPTSIRRQANKPLCDIRVDFHYQMGIKLHKVLSNTRKYASGNFNQFALAFINALLAQYHDHKQVVCKSPENLTPESFDVAIDILGNQPGFRLVYLYRRFEPYLASCHIKFAAQDIGYYADKYITWHSNAVEALRASKPPNVFVLDYDDLVADPTVVQEFSILHKTDPQIRQGTIDKWHKSEILPIIQKLAKDNAQQLDKIAKTIDELKFYGK